MATKEDIALLRSLLDYATHKKKPRGGWYAQAIEDCIETLQRGDFERVRRRDSNK